MDDDTRVEPTTAPAEERPAGGKSRGDRVRRQGRRARLYGAAAVAVVLIGLIIAWVVANTETVEVSWLFASTDAALALVIFVAAALGWLLGLATAAVIGRRTRGRRGSGPPPE